MAEGPLPPVFVFLIDEDGDPVRLNQWTGEGWKCMRNRDSDTLSFRWVKIDEQ